MLCRKTRHATTRKLATAQNIIDKSRFLLDVEEKTLPGEKVVPDYKILVNISDFWI